MINKCPVKLSGIAIKILSAYKEWNIITRHIPKMRRYSLGVKIDQLFADIIELVSMAQFSSEERRPVFIIHAISKNDCLKFMLYVLLELQGIEEKHFVRIAPLVEEIGKMLYGWKIKAEKILEQNRSGLIKKNGAEK